MGCFTPDVGFSISVVGLKQRQPPRYLALRVFRAPLENHVESKHLRASAWLYRRFAPDFVVRRAYVRRAYVRRA
jgi:hypothetical protein